MSTVKHAGWLFVTLALLACSGWYFSRAEPYNRLDAKTLSNTPDAFITDLTVQQFDAQGQLIHSLKTPLMQHIPRENTHKLTTPVIQVTQEHQAPWYIQAQTATAVQGFQAITFHQKVVIHQQAHTHQAETIMKTDEITYYPKTQEAKTPKKVTVHQSGNRIQAIGMNAYLAEQRVQLLSHAQGTYASNHG